MTNSIDARKSSILWAVVNEYERTAEPVGSKILANKYNIDASPATIRTEMAELEELGFLEQPHTSAGRTPTDKCWRYYIDELMEDDYLAAAEAKILKDEMDKIKIDLDNIVKKTSKIMSGFSHNLAIGTVLNPRDSYSSGVSELFREPEFSEQELALSVAKLIDNFEENIDRIYRQINRQDVEVRIGKENPFEIEDISTIFSSFSLSDGREGFFCIIGPKRMNYAKNICLADRIRNLLNE